MKHLTQNDQNWSTPWCLWHDLYRDPVEKVRSQTKFKDIDPTVEYTFRVCTLVNGKTISRKLFTLKPKQKAEETGSSAILDVIDRM